MQDLPTGDTTNSDERMWAMLCHLSAFAGTIIPLGTILGPLVVWLMKKEVYPLVDDQGKESLNIQISILIYALISAVSLVAFIGFLLLPAVLIFAVVMTIIATIKANSGVAYRYPLTIRLIR